MPRWVYGNSACGGRPPGWWRLACSSAGLRLAGLADELEPAPPYSTVVAALARLE